MEILLNSLPQPKTTSTDKEARIYLIIRLLYASMARISEICGLNISDINTHEKYIKVRGKGNKERFIPIDDTTNSILQDFIEDRQLESLERNPPLFVNIHNNRLTPRVIQKDLQILKAKRDFLSEKTFTPHILRHTGATHLRQEGMDLSELQDLLGHSSPNTTRIYAKNDISHLRDAYDRNHPLESHTPTTEN